MRHVMLMIGMGTAVLAGVACRAVPGTPLTTAAAANDLAGLRRLLAAGHLPDEDGDALTALMWASRRNAVDAVTLLLDAGADIARRDRRNGWSALQHAIHTRATDAVRVLLDRGADPNGAAHAGALTPLLMASLDADPTVVTLLLERGADPRVAGEWGDTPLTRAVSGGALADIDRGLLGGCHAATVRALLDYDPTLRLPDNFNAREAVWWARFHGCRDVLELVGAQAEGPIERNRSGRSGTGDHERDTAG